MEKFAKLGINKVGKQHASSLLKGPATKLVVSAHMLLT